MRISTRTGAMVMVGAWAALATGLAPAAGDPPTAVVEYTVVDEHRLSPNLTRECGVTVMVQLNGTRKLTLYPDRETGVVERFHTNVGVVATSDFGEVRFRHTGMWKVIVDADGTWLLHEAGQGPLGQKGRYLADITGAEEIVIAEAATSIEEGIAGFCAVLNP